jgi:energy-coupling factor transporter ATP-binding protein EcfA2
MEKLNFELRNCYGINYLQDSFDFTNKNIFSIYAPNGTMKTSFSKTFLRISEGKLPQDDLYGLESEFTITTEISGILTAIIPKEIFVIKPYKEYTADESISALLVNEERKTEYDTLTLNILSKKKSLISKLNRLSGVKKDDLEQILLRDMETTNLIAFLSSLNFEELSNQYGTIQYALIFNSDVLAFLQTDDVMTNIMNYITQYNSLLQASSYYAQGVFNPSKADTVSKTLTKENFFRAGHSIKLNGNENILSEEDFNRELAEAKRLITQNENLRKIEELITTKVSVKSFQDLISDNPLLIAELALNNLDNFKKTLWRSYIKAEQETITSLLLHYNEARERLEEIEEEARNQSTQWQKVVEKFKERFTVPFKIDIENKYSAVLGRETPNLIFKFEDNDGHTKNLKRDNLNNLDILSQGEKRALYLLNIIFEVEAKKINSQKTLFIVDDIADSFDYKNKYAIIEYLKEISETTNFYQIILTHNFDFFRTINRRLDMDRGNKLQVIKKTNELKLVKEIYQKNHPFQVWKDQIHNDVKYIIVLIPFVRNLIEYGKNVEVDFLFLTDLLHQKDTTKNIKFGELKRIYKEYLGKDNFGNINDTDLVYDSMIHYANNINVLEHSLENKIILAMAIRLKAEELMKTSIENSHILFTWSKKINRVPTTISGNKDEFLFFVSEETNQTRTLYNGYKQIPNNENLNIIESVLLMTPENIHLNSFMYEPIMDMSIDNLKNLYDRLLLNV